MLRSAFDTETFLIEPALLAPPMVCLTSKEGSEPGLLFHGRPERMTYGARDEHGCYVGAPTADEHLLGVMGRSDRVYGVNLAYDTCVMLAAYPHLAKALFEYYEREQFVDIALHERLIDIYRGRDRYNRNIPGYYSLAGMTKRYLGRDRSASKSDPDAWRLRYSELWDVDIKDWPIEAVDYALIDAIDPIEIATIQEDLHGDYLEDSPRQAKAAFGLQLMMCWGARTSPEQIDRLFEVSVEVYDKLRDRLGELSILRIGTNPQTGRPYPKSQAGTMDTRAVQQTVLEICKKEDLPVKLTDSGKDYFREQGFEREARNGYIDVDAFRELPIEEKDPKKRAKAEKALKGLPNIPTRKYVCTDAETCESLHDDRMTSVAQYKKAKKLVEIEVPDLRKGVVTPLQPQYNTLVESGRTSCRKGKPKSKNAPPPPTNGYQVQNPLRGLPFFPTGVGTRECFEARPGTLYIDNDVTGLELSTVAEACLETVGYSKLGELINKGIDPHLWFGAKLAGCTYEEAVERRHTKEMKKYRSMAKPANFGLPGGMGVKGFRAFARGYGIVLSEQEATNLIADWKEAFEEFVDYFKFIDGHMDYDGEGLFEQLFIKRFRKTYYTSACNTLFQGLGGDVMKHAMFLVAKGCYVPGADPYLYGVRPWGFIHDEILAETTSRDRAVSTQQAFALARVMETGCNHYLRRVPVKVEPALSLRFCKAESVYDEDGLLLPYDVARDESMDAWYSDGKKVKW